MDSTRLTQWGTWSGASSAGGADLPIDRVYGTKDRSWGMRPVGEATPAAPENTLPQIFFLWAPINWDDCCTHFLCFERGNGDRFVGSQAVLQLVGDGDPTWGVDATARHRASRRHGRQGALGARAAAFAGRDAAAAAPQRRRGAHRARAVAHVPHARPRVHASRSGATAAGTARTRSGPRSTRSRSSTTSSRGTSTSSRSCGRGGAIASGSVCSSSSRSVSTGPSGLTGFLDGFAG